MCYLRNKIKINVKRVNGLGCLNYFQRGAHPLKWVRWRKPLVKDDGYDDGSNSITK